MKLEKLKGPNLTKQPTLSIIKQQQRNLNLSSDSDDEAPVTETDFDESQIGSKTIDSKNGCLVSNASVTAIGNSTNLATSTLTQTFTDAQTQAQNLKDKIGNSISELNLLYEKFMSSKVDAVQARPFTQVKDLQSFEENNEIMMSQIFEQELVTSSDNSKRTSRQPSNAATNQLKNQIRHTDVLEGQIEKMLQKGNAMQKFVVALCTVKTMAKKNQYIKSAALNYIARE